MSSAGGARRGAAAPGLAGLAPPGPAAGRQPRADGCAEDGRQRGACRCSRPRRVAQHDAPGCNASPRLFWGCRLLAVSRRHASPRRQVVVYIWSPEEEGQFQPGRCNRWWLHNSLKALSVSLRKLGSRLVLRSARQARAPHARAAGPHRETDAVAARRTAWLRLWCSRLSAAGKALGTPKALLPCHLRCAACAPAGHASRPPPARHAAPPTGGTRIGRPGGQCGAAKARRACAAQPSPDAFARRATPRCLSWWSKPARRPSSSTTSTTRCLWCAQQHARI